MASDADAPPDDVTVRKVGKSGNSYENNPGANRHASARVRVLRRRNKTVGAAAAAAAVDAMSESSRKLDPGGSAAVDHGAPVGARNVLNFHSWKADPEAPVANDPEEPDEG